MTTAALVLGAGLGERLGAEIPKAFVPLRGVPLMLRSLRVLDTVPAIEFIVPVVGSADGERYASMTLEGLAKVGNPVTGGALRQDSMAAGVAALPGSTEWVAVHDAARCLVDVADVGAVIAAARESGAAILAERVRDTIKRVRGGRIVETPDRSECWAAQTPQVFRYDLLREAIEKAGAEGWHGTDDAELVERMGVPVRVVESQAPNPKITLAEDLAQADRWLAREDG
jgi:2-C-methyl-D-erythritol 4-phosphate cytidylyltransferase